ncbi:alpha-1,2-glucosyltransferase [Entomortierella parvispora]|uniref:Dol-P-Glc:Glc(2)Man(9)GlcNAc(2)-PP-Dol alpha-1,2-glucosyltransferase n=1 Tax=Entomortierella parvispora TaxID=205924 RepID=A0A9P3HHI2_9FUNG|nr:alpha-1,2-glucosyltransferase [Entomortierella parvispora]
MSASISPAALVGMHLVVMLFVASIWNKTVSEPYMDEIFHIPQAQRYCQGDYWTWDPKLTTPPGLYVISNILLAVLRPLCSAPLLRLTNMVYPFMTLYAIDNLLKELHPQQTRRQRFRSAAVIISFPLLWFFNFLYYTDGGSAAFVLLSWLAAKQRHHFLSAVTSAIAVTFRQTNIIWSLFILGTTLLELSSTTERRRFDPKAAFLHSPFQIVKSILGFVQMLLSKLPTVLVVAIPYLGLLGGFVAFVRWNGGIVLGDRSNHVPVMHVVQLFYFAVFSAGMSIFAILGAVPIARLLKWPNARSLTVIGVLLAVVLFCIDKFTYVHPFLLADNRHYTFYIWRLVTRFHAAGPYLLAPVYLICGWCCWQALATEQTILWVLIYGVATALTLIPSPLLEFRYFIAPYLIYRISMRQPRGVWLLLELLTYVAINAFTVYMFLYRPFKWTHQAGVQRFMW